MLRNPGRVGAVEVSCAGACRNAPAWPCHFKRFRGAAECGASAVIRVVRVAQHASRNLVSLCSVCHLDGVHLGRLKVVGSAPELTWVLGRTPVLRVDGRERG